MSDKEREATAFEAGKICTDPTLTLHDIQQIARPMMNHSESEGVAFTLGVGIASRYGEERMCRERGAMQLAYSLGCVYGKKQHWTPATVIEGVADIIAQANVQRMGDWSMTLRHYGFPFTAFILGVAAAARQSDEAGGMEALLEASVAQAKAAR